MNHSSSTQDPKGVGLEILGRSPIPNPKADLHSLGLHEEDINAVTIMTNVVSQPKICFVSPEKSSKKSFRVTLQPDFLNQSGTDCVCPVSFCRKKIVKNRSIEDHIRGHLIFIFQEIQGEEASVKDGFDVLYHCPDGKCKYSDEDNQGFARVKYLKQHYLKIHAPKNLTCPHCKKKFAAASFMRSHIAMCGKSFTCSCHTSYTSLEALQTHARRKNHSFDVVKYKELLRIEKGRYQDSITGNDTENSASVDSSTCERVTTNVSNNSKELSIKNNSSCKKYPSLLPRPNTNTNPNSSSVIDFIEITNSNPKLHFGMMIGEVMQLPKTTIDFGTQTVPQNHLNFHSSSHSATHQTSGVHFKKMTGDNYQDAGRLQKRKKSAETQTARVHFRISTETQTTNVVKRRRSNRKKQSAEAQTQCHQELCQSQKLAAAENKDHLQHESNQLVQMPIPIVPSSAAPVPISRSTSTLVSASTSTSTTAAVSTETIDLDAFRKEDSMANPISDFENDSFFKEMEEVHIQTQTEPDLFLGGENVFSDYDVHVNLNDTDVSNFLNFVSIETQTAHPCTSKSTHNWLEPTNYIETSIKSDVELNSAEVVPSEEPVGGSLSTNNISYLETMDSETQTHDQLYDFGSILSKMFQ